MCTPFSYDIPRDENTFLVLTMKYDNIVTILELKKTRYICEKRYILEVPC